MNKSPFSAKPVSIAAGALIVLFTAIGCGQGDPSAPPESRSETTSTTTTAAESTTTTPNPPTATTPSPAPTTQAQVKPTIAKPPPPPPPPVKPKPSCDPNYSGCVPIASDVDCAGGSGNGPAYAEGPIRVTGDDIYGLDSNDDGTACES